MPSSTTQILGTAAAPLVNSQSYLASAASRDTSNAAVQSQRATQALAAAERTVQVGGSDKQRAPETNPKKAEASFSTQDDRPNNGSARAQAQGNGKTIDITA